MTDPAPNVWPSVRSRDPLALITFLVEAFGFEQTVAYKNDEGVVEHAELVWPLGGGLMLGSDRPRSTATAPGALSCYVVADDIDDLYDRAVKAGANVVTPPYDTNYGSRDFAALDPEGNRWSFGTYRGAPR
jgi:uncharacterized glyoxalase superfamily protein PhnB